MTRSPAAGAGARGAASAVYVATPLTGAAGRAELQAQRRRVRAYLRAEGWRARHHAHFADLGSSAAPRWRPAMQELLAAAPRGEWRRVTAESRALSDDPLLCLSIRQELAGLGVELALVPEEFDPAAAPVPAPRGRGGRPRSVVAEMRSLVARVQAAVAENAALRREQARLRAELAAIERRAALGPPAVPYGPDGPPPPR